MTINEYCLDLLKRNGVSTDCYAGEKVREVACQVREYLAENCNLKDSDLVKKMKFSATAIAKELIRIGNWVKPPMKELHILENTRWGWDELYEDSHADERQRLTDAIEGDMPFDSGWISPSKTEQSYRISRELRGGPILIECHEEMDDWLDDIITDAGCEIGKEKETYAACEDREWAESIYDEACECDCSGTEWTGDVEITERTFEAVENALRELQNDVQAKLHENFEGICNIVKYRLDGNQTNP